MSTGKRAGFTLVELLVVIAIIGILVSLISAAAMQTMGSARRSVACTNNQHELWTAVQIYESRKQRYPGWRARIGNRQSSWVVQLMPYLGMQNDYDRVFANAAATVNNGTYSVPANSPTAGLPALSGIIMPAMTLTLCPSDDQDSPGGPWLSYGANNGILDTTGGTPPAIIESKANGIFFDHWDVTPTNPPAKFLYNNASFLQGKDGTATTLGLGENRRLYDWTGFGSSGTVVLEYLTGFVWENYSTVPTQSWLKFPVNQTDTGAGKLLTTTAVDASGTRLNGPHGNVVIVTFADGHSIAMNQTIDYTVYNRLCTPDGSALGQLPLDTAMFVK